MVSENPNLKVDPPTLDYPHRGESEVVVEVDAPATEETMRVEARISSLAVLCMLSALLGFLFFPALAALPLGILALKRQGMGTHWLAEVCHELTEDTQIILGGCGLPYSALISLGAWCRSKLGPRNTILI